MAEDSPTKDILLQYIERQWNQALQSENQRATAINLVVVLVISLQGYMVEREFDVYCLPLALGMAIVPAYGLLLTWKYYERFRLACSRAGRAMDRLAALYPEGDLNAIERMAEIKHRTKFPRMFTLRLHYLWSGFLTFLVCAGALNIVVVLAS